MLELYVGKVKHFRKYLARRRKWFLRWKEAEEMWGLPGK